MGHPPPSVGMVHPKIVKGGPPARAKIRSIGYGVRSDFELNFGRYLPSFGRADDDDTDSAKSA